MKSSNQPIPTQPGATLTITPRSAKLTKDADWFGKMDPFVQIKIGSDMQRTETAKAFGKTPIWKTPLIFKLTSEQVSQPDKVVINFEVLDEDSAKKSEFLGIATYHLSQLKAKSSDPVTLKIVDNKNKQVGSLDVSFDYNVPAPVENKIPTTGIQSGIKPLIGTVFVKLGQGKFDVGVSNLQDLTLAFVHNGIACQTGLGEGPERKPVLRNNAIFQLYEGEEMNVKCIKSNKGKEEILGEAQIQLSTLSKRESLHNLSVILMKTGKKVGEMSLEIEFFNYIFENPVKIYPLVAVKKGESVPKKIKYSNPDTVKKNIIVQSENKNLMTVKTEKLTILPRETVEIKIDVWGPQAAEEKCRIDVIVEDTRIIEESLLFKIKAL